jgi:hypothetical protein
MNKLCINEYIHDQNTSKLSKAILTTDTTNINFLCYILKSADFSEK